MSNNKLIGERIKSRRMQLDMSQEQLANKIGYKSKSSINKIELGVQGLTQSKIKDIADALHTTPAYIMGWTDDQFPIETKRVPLYGDIACGQPIVCNREFECYVEAGTDVQCDFCVRAHGDSMVNARILDGDIVFIREQPAVDNGEIAAVVIDDECTLKKVYDYSDRLVLQAENPSYEPIVYVGEEKDHIKILGKAVAFQSDVR